MHGHKESYKDLNLKIIYLGRMEVGDWYYAFFC